MASCVRHIRTKNYQNLVIAFQVTVKNVWDVFLRHSVVMVHCFDVICLAILEGHTQRESFQTYSITLYRFLLWTWPNTNSKKYTTSGSSSVNTVLSHGSIRNFTWHR